MTSSHSSSLMRGSRVSRVMPALFTRISSRPCFLGDVVDEFVDILALGHIAGVGFGLAAGGW